MEFQFNEMQEMIRSTAHQLCEGIIAGRVDEIEETKMVPDDIFHAIADTGLLGAALPEAYGGVDCGHVAIAAAMEEFGKVSAAVGASVLVSITFLETIKNYGTEEQKQTYIPDGIAGKFRGSFAFTEPNTGSDPRQIETTATEDGDYFILNGVKRFITNASYEGPIIIWAREAGTEKDITAFILDKFCEGYSLSSPWDLVCLKGSPVYDIFLDNVRVHKSRILGKRGEGFPILEGTVAHSKTMIVASNVGGMLDSYERAVQYAREKKHRGVTIGKFQSIQLAVAKIAARVEAARMLVYRLAEESDDRSDLDHLKAWVGMVKAYVAEEAEQVSIACLHVMGPYGLAEEYKIERNVRDALLGPNVEGVADMQRVIAGARIMFSDDALIL